MTAPLVSVVVPVYNGAKYLRDACDSVLSQTYSPLELIVVDDGSTDDSSAVIQSYGDRIVSIRQNNGGVSRARNSGIRAAKGVFVAFLDQDDWWLPDKIARQVERFRSDESLGLVHTGILQFSSESKSFVNGIYENISSDPLQGWCYDQLLLGNGIINSSVMVRQSALSMCGVFDENMSGNTVQDYDLWIRVARNFPLSYVSESLTVLRLHKEQGTWDRVAMLSEESRMLERILTKEEVQRSRALRRRMARLYENLGIAHLDAGQSPSAGRCFIRSLGLQKTRRRALLYAAALLPNSCIDWLRRARVHCRVGKLLLSGFLKETWSRETN